MKTFCHKLYPLSKGVYCITLTVALWNSKAEKLRFTST
jgi:hypothetical protein